MYKTKHAVFSDLVGKTIASIVDCHAGSCSVDFHTVCGRKFTLTHYQDCCEEVDIVDVIGDVGDLLGAPILLAEEVSNPDPATCPENRRDESGTWTFYKLATAKGYVTIRWLGTSNGYYSESVDFHEDIST